MYMKHVNIMSQLLETTMTYAGDVRDYENCNAAMRNIDPDCNLFNFSNTTYYLEDDINEIIKRNNLSENEFSLMHLNIRSLPKNIGKLCDFLSLMDTKFTIIGLSETWLHSDNVDRSIQVFMLLGLLRKEGVYHYMSIVHLSILCYQK